MRRILLASVMALAACASTAPPPPPPSPDGRGGRDCGTSVHGDLGPDWREAALIEGPLAIADGWAFYETAEGYAGNPPGPDGWRAFKMVFTVRNGHILTVSIPLLHRHRAHLRYAGGDHHTVVFTACPQNPPNLSAQETQFEGSIAIREPGCLPLNLAWALGSGQISLGFGRRC